MSKEEFIKIAKAVEVHIQNSSDYKACIGLGQFTERFNEVWDNISSKIPKVKPTEEQFNQIGDIRPYLLTHPDGNMITNACLHYLGDDAQAWWENKHQ